MDDFLRFVNDLRRRYALHLEISYSKITDWTITVYRRGMADDYPISQHEGKDVILCHVQSCDMEFAFARAQVALKTWLIANEGGY